MRTSSTGSAGTSHYPANPQRIVPQTPLSQTRQAGERFRERWFEQLARESRTFGWNDEQIRGAAARGADNASLCGNIRKPSTRSELIRQGRLAAHPAVRDEYDRLVKLRDVAWQAHPDLMRTFYHGPSQALIDILKRQSRTAERHHVADLRSYIG